MLSIDINCDMGESTHLWPYDLEKDKLLLSYVSSINLACGYHAGDAHTMYALAEAAAGTGIVIGAHPGYPDRDNFGRTDMDLSPSAVYELMIYQMGALDAFLRVLHTRLHHVKPHGALYNRAAKDETIAEVICKAVYDYDPHLVLYGLSGSKLIQAATATGLRTCSEVFADRTYQDDGHLTPRSHPQALLTSTDQALQQVLQMVTTQSVTSLHGKTVPLVAETICVHGDGVRALEFVKEIRIMLMANGVEVGS
ncbi:lactam utilization protein LamB [Niastella yeongjuensis]|uniref:Lactam utilization protein LamB n=1 Tax=Niastella yeongjuensis TaxID=354355 RepID=A0A1V9EUF4_9BACT|nr:5-oxoprolinase subunit PxpA [Niastella yeongjuensis]OQP49711.1 lactam utilization protein LamB [Niastella yeongjuensis]